MKSILGMDVFLCTGDQRATAAAVARRVGISPKNVFAEALPTEKMDFVKRLRRHQNDIDEKDDPKHGEKVFFI